MNVKVLDFEKEYHFKLMPITQLCGENIRSKNYILESIRRYFSGYRYAEERNRWRDNVYIEGKLAGRKQFSVISITKKQDIIDLIRLSKQSLMMEYIKSIVQEFDGQIHMEVVSQQLEQIFLKLNENLKNLGNVEVTFEQSGIWEMVQKSEIKCGNEGNLEDLEEEELLHIFFNLLNQVLIHVPRSMIVIIENIDHLITREKYEEIYYTAKEVSKSFDAKFIFTNSMKAYPLIDWEYIEGITILNDEIFSLPTKEHIVDFVHEQYPRNVSMTEREIEEILKNILQDIGKQKYLVGLKEQVVCKMFNTSLGYSERRNFLLNAMDLE